MMRVSGCAGLVAAALLGPLARAAAPDGAPAAQVPAAAFATVPQVSEVQLSPDGNLLAWLDQSGPVGKVVIFDLATKKFQRGLSVDPSLTPRSLVWTDNNTLLIGLTRLEEFQAEEGQLRTTFYRTVSLAVDSGKSCMLLLGGDLLAWHTPKPHTVLFATRGYSANAWGVVSELFEVDTSTCKQNKIEEGNQNTGEWVVDASGKAIARSEWEPQRSHYSVEVRESMGWHRVFERSGWMTLYGLTADGKSVIATGPEKDGSGWDRLWAIALDGSGARELHQSDGADADVEYVVNDRFSGTPVKAVLGGLDAKFWWLDTATQTIDESVAHAFPGQFVRVYSRSEDGTRVVARVVGPTNAAVYYLIDFKTHGADIIGEAYPGLDHVTLGPVRSMTYPARDGTRIPAYLTLPPGMAAKNLPMVVLPHDWPNWRDDPDFDWLTQFLASRGYAVLQPQFRGTPGFGEAFYRAGKRQLGGLMQNDITDGVKAMVQQGIADPHRVCIVGIGFGGYAALAGAAFTPQLYACAASIDGVSDLPAFLGFRQVQAPGYTHYWEEQIGSRFDHTVIDRSPINSVADVRAPVLLVHDADDTFIPYSQSERMASELAGLGKTVALVKLEAGDQALAKSATRLEVLQDLALFLHQYLK